MSSKAKRRDIGARSIVTGQTNWRHAGKFVPKDFPKENTDGQTEEARNPAMTRPISIINANPLSNQNTEANVSRCKVSFSFAHTYNNR